MGDFSLDNNGKAGKLNQDNFKGGVKREQLKEKKYQQLFDFADKNNDGILDSSETELLMKNLNTDEDMSEISAKEAKAYLKNAASEDEELKDLKKDDLFNFLKEFSQAGENIASSKFSEDSEGRKTIYITYKDGSTETVFPDKSREVSVEENGVKTTKCYVNNVLSKQTVDTDEETTIVEYAQDGTTTETQTITSKKDSSKKTITYADGKPVSAIVENGITQINYTYDENGNEVKTSKIENKGIPAKEKRTDYTYDENGTETAVTTENGKTSTTVTPKDGKSVTTEKDDDGSDVTTTTQDDTTVRVTDKPDGTKITETVTADKTTVVTQNPDGSSTESVTDAEGNETVTKFNKSGKRTEQSVTKDGRTYHAKYDGRGNTYITVQNGESPAAIAKKFHITTKTLLGMNKYNTDGLGNKYFQVGKTIKVPGEYDADNKLLTVRKSSAAAKNDYVASGAAAREAAVQEEAAARKKITWTEKNYNKFEDIARSLYKQEGVKNPTQMQLSRRVKDLKKLNPNLKDGQLKGKKITAGVNPKRYEQVETSQKARETKKAQQKAAAENTKVQKQSAAQIAQDLIKSTDGFNDIDAMEKAIAKIDTPEELAEVNKLLAAKGYKADDKYSPLEKFIYEEHNHTYVHTYNSSDYLEQIVQKQISNGTLKGDAANKAQARMACRVIFDGGDGFGTDCDKIKKGVRMIKCPKASGNSQTDKKNAKAVYDEVNRIIKKHNTFYGLGSKCKDLVDYCEGEMWSSEVKYLKGILAESNAIQGKEKAKAITDLTKEAVEGAGTDIDALKQAIKAIDSPADLKAVEKRLEAYCKKKGIKPKIEGQSYLQAVLYDECDTFLGVSTDHKEIRKFNEMLIKQGAYTADEAVKIRAEQAALEALDGGFDNIQDALSNISDAKVLAKMNELLKTKNYNGIDGLVANKFKNDKTKQDLLLSELAANKLLPDNQAASIALRLVQNSDFNARAKGLCAIRTGAQAQAVDKALKAKGSSLAKVYEQFNKEKAQYKSKAKLWDGYAQFFGFLGNVQGGSWAEHISDKYRENTDMSDTLYVETSKAQNISKEKKEVYDATVKDFEERLNKMKEDYEAALGSQGVISGAINEFCSIYNIGTTRDEIEARIEHDTETLRLMKLAANGKLAKMVNGKLVAVSFEDMFSDRQSNISGANGISNTGNVDNTVKTKLDTKKITEVNKHANQIAAMDLAKDQIGQTWNELSDALNSNDSARLSTAIYSSLTKLSQMSGQQMSLEALGFKLQNGKVVDKNGKAATTEQLKTIANQLKQGLSDISSTLLGQKIPMNAKDDEVTKLLDKGYENKLEQFKQEYRAAYNQEPPDDLLDSYKSTIETGVMIANIGVSIGAVIAAPFTGGGSLAVFCAAAGSTLVMQGLEQSTDEDGWTNDEWTKTTVDSAWNGALAVLGMQVGMIADKAAQGGYKIAASVIAKQEKLIRSIAPNISAEKLRIASIIVARAEAAGFEVTSDALQSVVQTYCVKGEFDAQQFTTDLLMSIAGNVAGHITSAIGDIKTGKPTVDPSKPSVDPNKPSVDPSKPTVDPNKPSVDPSKPDIDEPSISTKVKEKIKDLKDRVMLRLGIGAQAKAAKLKEAQIEALASMVDKNGNPRFSETEIANIMSYVKTDISPATLKAITSDPSWSVLTFQNFLKKVDTPQKARLAGMLLEADATGAKKWNLDIFEVEQVIENTTALAKVTNYEQFVKDLMNSDVASSFTLSSPGQVLFSILNYVETDSQKQAFESLLDICKKRNITELGAADLLVLNRIQTADDAAIFAKYMDKYLMKGTDGKIKASVLSLFGDGLKVGASAETMAIKRKILKFSLDNEKLPDIEQALKTVDSDKPAAKIIVDYMLQNKDIPSDIELMRTVELKTDLQKQAFTKLLGDDKFEALSVQEIIDQINDEKSLNLLTDLLDKGYDTNTIITSLKKGEIDTSGLDKRVSKNNALRTKALKSFQDNQAKIPSQYRSKVSDFAKSNPKRYLKMEEAGLFDLIESGKINSGILDNINDNTFLSNRTLDEIRRIKNNEPYVKTLSSTADIAKAGNGNVCEINGKLYVNDNGTAVELNISKDKFEELFPPLTSVTFEQGALGDCWLVTGIDNYLDLPSGRVALYKLLKQEGNDILVQFPNNPPIRFKDGQVLDANGVQIRGTQPGAPVGVQMIEQAYAVHRSKSYTSTDVNTPTDITSFAADPQGLMEKLRSGNTTELNETILGRNDSYVDSGTISSKKDIKEAIEKFANDENTILFFGTKGESDAYWLDKTNDLVQKHGYAIKGYDPETGMVYITNPHHVEVITEVPMSELLKHASFVGYSDLRPATATVSAASATTVTSPSSKASVGSISEWFRRKLGIDPSSSGTTGTKTSSTYSSMSNEDIVTEYVNLRKIAEDTGYYDQAKELEILQEMRGRNMNVGHELFLRKVTDEDLYAVALRGNEKLAAGARAEIVRRGLQLPDIDIPTPKVRTEITPTDISQAKSKLKTEYKIKHQYTGDYFDSYYGEAIDKILQNATPETFDRCVADIKVLMDSGVKKLTDNHVQFLTTQEGLDAFDKAKKFFGTASVDALYRSPLDTAITTYGLSPADINLAEQRLGGLKRMEPSRVKDIISLSETEFNTLKSSGLLDKGITYASKNSDINRFYAHISDSVKSSENLKNIESWLIKQTGGDTAKIKEITDKLCAIKDKKLFDRVFNFNWDSKEIDLDAVAEYGSKIKDKFTVNDKYSDWYHSVLEINSTNKVLVNDLLEMDGITLEQFNNVLQYCDTPAKTHHVQTIIDNIKAGKEDIIALPFVKHAEVSKKVAQSKYAQTPKFEAGTSLDTVLGQTKQGQVAAIGNKVYINDRGKMTELQMDLETYEKLFPAYETNVLQQGSKTADCYFLSGGLIAFQRNDYARPYLLKMIKQEGNDIVITFPGYPNNPVRFKNGELTSGTLHVGKTSMGNRLIEQAYAKAKYAANHGIKDASTVDMDTAMDYIGHGCEHWVMNEITGGEDATLYIRSECREAYNRMKKEEGYDFKKHGFVTEDKKDDLLDKLAGKDNYIICAGSGSRDAGYIPDYGVTPNHAYCIENIDKVNKTVTIVNPFNSLYSMTLTYEQFWDGFSTISVKELSV